LRANWRGLHAALMDSSADEPLRPVEERGAPAAVLQATLMDTFTFMGVFSGGLMDNSTDESTLECTSAASWTLLCCVLTTCATLGLHGDGEKTER
jgi:hypothetical protein